MGEESSAQASEAEVERAVEAVYAYAAELMKAKVPDREIEEKLVDKGLERSTAGVVVGNLSKVRAKAMSEAGRKNMLYGGLWCVGGIIVTAVTYGAAGGGGSYVVAWGAIIFGAIQFFRGLAQSNG